MADNIKIIAKNTKAYYNYQILERFEAGIVLRGTEVKALREGRCSLKDSYAKIINGEIWLIGMNIGAYTNTGFRGHDPERERKLLFHRHEIKRLHRKVMEKGVTLVPLSIYFKKGNAKLEIAIAAGKREFDKRAAIAERDKQREMKRIEKKFRIK